MTRYAIALRHDLGPGSYIGSAGALTDRPGKARKWSTAGDVEAAAELLRRTFGLDYTVVDLSGLAFSPDGSAVVDREVPL